MAIPSDTLSTEPVPEPGPLFTSASLPVASRETGLAVLRGLARERSLLAALSLMNRYVGNIFQITMPRFNPAVVVGPETNRQVLVTERDKLLFRTESDPVTKLLHHGVLVTDGELHDELRAVMSPAMLRPALLPRLDKMRQAVDTVSARWEDGAVCDMLVEMRKIALLVLNSVLFNYDFQPDMERMWEPIINLLEYISPGLWIFWPGMPRPKYRKSIQIMDEFLYTLIHHRRIELTDLPAVATPSDDLLSRLVLTPGMSDPLIRDQLLTMLIAGHDTSTAQLAWTIYLLGQHADSSARVQQEVDAVLGDQVEPPSPEQLNQLEYLELCQKEALRLYPPIHVGNRLAATDLALGGYHIPAGRRVLYSIFLSHRMPEYWSEPEAFRPERFVHRALQHPPPLTYIPFGGGPRNCIGATMAQIESKVVLGRLYQGFEFELLNGSQIKPHMGATLEPRPGVLVRVRRRNKNASKS